MSLVIVVTPESARFVYGIVSRDLRTTNHEPHTWLISANWKDTTSQVQARVVTRHLENAYICYTMTCSIGISVLLHMRSNNNKTERVDEIFSEGYRGIKVDNNLKAVRRKIKISGGPIEE